MIVMHILSALEKHSLIMYKGSKIKMLKDVGMTVPKSRETSVVYICSNTGNEGTIRESVVYICSNTGNEGTIRESVDSLCSDGADTDTPIYQMERLIAPERYSYKPFQTYNKALRVFLYHIRPSKYVKYTYTMTYGNCHSSVFEIFGIIFFFFFKWSTSKLTNALTFLLA